MKEMESPSRPRLVVVLDGLNQRPYEDWHEIIARLNSLLYEIGGVLIITVRTVYFQASIENSLHIDTNLSKIDVKEWTKTERKQYLKVKGR